MSDGSMRASDADRAKVAERLQLALTEGRLDLDEYDERIRLTYAAKTYADLAAITRDLPHVPDDQLPEAARRQAELARRERRRQRIEEWREWAAGAVIMVGIWGVISLVAGNLIFFWPGIPLGIWAVVLLSSALGGARDDDT